MTGQSGRFLVTQQPVRRPVPLDFPRRPTFLCSFRPATGKLKGFQKRRNTPLLATCVPSTPSGRSRVGQWFGIRSGFRAENAAGPSVGAVPPGIAQVVDPYGFLAARCMSEFVVAQEDTDVVKRAFQRKEDQVTRLEFGPLDVDTSGSLFNTDARQRNAQLPVHIERQATAIKSVRTDRAPAVRFSDLAEGKIGHQVTRFSSRCVRFSCTRPPPDRQDMAIRPVGCRRSLARPAWSRG